MPRGSGQVNLAEGRYQKFPRVPHLPWSEKNSQDDIILTEVEALLKEKEVVVLYKLDGENTTLYSDHIHARSLDSGYHPSRTWVKNLHGQIGYRIPKGWRVCGENMQATHSVAYKDLPSYFMVFGIIDDQDKYLSWDEVKEWSEKLGLVTVPEIYRGPFDKDLLGEWREAKSPYNKEQNEGYVIRTARSFPIAEFKDMVAKFVRDDFIIRHNQAHWHHRQLIENKLAK